MFYKVTLQFLSSQYNLWMVIAQYSGQARCNITFKNSNEDLFLIFHTMDVLQNHLHLLKYSQLDTVRLLLGAKEGGSGPVVLCNDGDSPEESRLWSQRYGCGPLGSAP